jgi:hypothetical protein
MQSCVYECHVMHHRFAPQAHRFVYRLFLLALDLDELDTLRRRLRFFSVNRGNLFSFHESDHCPTHLAPHHPSTKAVPPSAGASLKTRVLNHLAAQGIALEGGRVVLVTLPRMFGYLFNPVCFYFCHDRAGRLAATVAEVTNTFREVKLFTLGPACRDAAGAFRLRAPKHFYVSPFSDVDVAFDFTLRPLGDRFSVQIDDYAGTHRTLTSTLTGPRRALTDAALASYLFKYPLLTLRVITLIHWHALRLWLKRVPWFAKSARAADQRDLYRPHASLAHTPATDTPPVSPGEKFPLTATPPPSPSPLPQSSSAA